MKFQTGRWYNLPSQKSRSQCMRGIRLSRSCVTKPRIPGYIHALFRRTLPAALGAARCSAASHQPIGYAAQRTETERELPKSVTHFLVCICICIFTPPSSGRPPGWRLRSSPRANPSDQRAYLPSAITKSSCSARRLGRGGGVLFRLSSYRLPSARHALDSECSGHMCRCSRRCHAFASSSPMTVPPSARTQTPALDINNLLSH